MNFSNAVELSKSATEILETNMTHMAKGKIDHELRKNSEF